MMEHNNPVVYEDTLLTERELRKIRRSVERPVRLSRLAVRVGATALTLSAILHTDIAYNRWQLEDTEPQIHHIADALSDEYRDQTTVYIDGFAGNDGSWITTKMTPAIQAAHDTNVAALEYDPDGISPYEIATRIAELAERDNLTSVSLHGYSIGGMISLEVATILQDNYMVCVDRIFLDQSPESASTIKSTVRDPATTLFVDIMGTAKSLGFDMEYSGIAREVFELLSPNDMNHLQQSTTKLMRDQFMYGINVDVEEFMKKLSAQSTCDVPTIVYVSSTSPERDYMVDLRAAEDRYRELSSKYDLPFMTITIEDAVHSRPDLTIEAYERAFAEARDTITQYDEVVADIPNTLRNNTREEQYDENTAECKSIPDKDSEAMLCDKLQ